MIGKRLAIEDAEEPHRKTIGGIPPRVAGLAVMAPSIEIGMRTDFACLYQSRDGSAGRMVEAAGALAVHWTIRADHRTRWPQDLHRLRTEPRHTQGKPLRSIGKS